MWTRAEFIRLSASGAAGLWVAPLAALGRPGLQVGRGQVEQPQQGGDVRTRISRLIQEFDAQGIHRTATAVDAASGDWLLAEARRAGGAAIQAALEPFAIERVDVRAAFVEAAGRRIEGLPLYDSSFTDDRGVSGRLAPAGETAPVVLTGADGAAITSEGRTFQALRQSKAHQAIIVVTNGAHAGLSPMNAVDFEKPYGCPVLQVSSEESAWLESLVKSRTEIRFVAHAVRTPSQGMNVFGSVAGTQPGLPPVVVMTPRSGWWQCASERGGGIACWTEAIRAVAASRPARTVRFIASSGHELGHFGLDAHLSKQGDLIRTAAAWVHLGANIGAAGGRLRIQASSDEIEAIGLAALDRVGAPVPQRVPRGNVPGGEARNIHVGGGRYVSILGSSPVFHSAADRWPAAVDLDALGRYAGAVGDLVLRLANGS